MAAARRAFARRSRRNSSRKVRASAFPDGDGKQAGPKSVSLRAGGLRAARTGGLGRPPRGRPINAREAPSPIELGSRETEEAPPTRTALILRPEARAEALEPLLLVDGLGPLGDVPDAGVGMETDMDDHFSRSRRRNGGFAESGNVRLLFQSRSDRQRKRLGNDGGLQGVCCGHSFPSWRPARPRRMGRLALPPQAGHRYVVKLHNDETLLVDHS